MKLPNVELCHVAAFCLLQNSDTRRSRNIRFTFAHRRSADGDQRSQWADGACGRRDGLSIGLHPARGVFNKPSCGRD